MTDIPIIQKVSKATIKTAAIIPPSILCFSGWAATKTPQIVIATNSIPKTQDLSFMIKDLIQLTSLFIDHSLSVLCDDRITVL